MASIVKNTSLTLRDIGDMSYPELEKLIEGLNKNAEREAKELESIEKGGSSTSNGNANDLFDFVSGGGF